jgi:hypothetical protein
MRRAACILAVFGAFLAAAGTAQAATINVACGNTTALVNAITTANGTTAADTINVTGAPCGSGTSAGFVLTTAAAPGSGGNDTGLPFVTQPLTIQGNGATIQRSSSAPNFRIMLASGAALDLHNLTISGGKLTGTGFLGAGIATLNAPLTMDGVTLVGNQNLAGSGGGLVTFGGSAVIDHSALDLNLASNGGGLYAVGATITVRRSLLFENVADNAAHNGSTGAALITGSTANFENDTFSLNLADNAIGGIGVLNSGALQSNVTVESSTFADNGNSVAAGGPPGGAIFTCGSACGGTAAAPVVHVHNTIVTDTDSTAPAVLKPCDTDFGGSIVNDGGNLEWPGTSCGFATHADPKLAASGANGGVTANYRLLPTSPAIDLGTTPCPATDQRDKVRPGGDACDAGSFETHPPQTTASAPGTAQSAPQVTFSSNQPNSTFECRVDGGAFAVCTSPFTVTGVSDGSHTVDVRASAPDPSATPATNNVYTDPSPASATVLVDTTAPVVTIGSVTSPTSDRNPDIPFTVSEPASTTCQVDSGAQVACTSPYTTPNLSDGTHTVTVRATDTAGNTGSAQVTVVVATHGPDAGITSGPAGTVLGQKATFDATFTFTANPPDGATFECKLDTAAFAACTSPTTYTVAPGAHTFTVRAIGPSGLVDPSPAVRNFTYKKCTVVLGQLCIG